MSFDFGGFYLAGTGVATGGGGGGGATNLSGLTDVQLSALTTGQVLTWNAVAGKWQNQAAGGFGVLAGLLASRPANPTTNAIYIVAGDTNTNNGRTFVYQLSTTTWREISPPSILTGTLAARPLTTTINTIYVVSGDPLPANNGTAAIYNTALSAWIPLAGGATTAMATGTLASRPASPTIDTMYVVSGDSATNNGRSFYYNLATTTWIEMVEPDILSGTLAARPVSPAINTLYVVNGDATATNNQRLFFYRASTSTWTELNYVQKDGDTMSGTLILEPTSGSALQVKDFGTGDVIFEIDPLLVHGIFYSPGAHSSPGSGEITELSGGVVNVASGATNPTNPNYFTILSPGFARVDNGSGVPPLPTLPTHLTSKKYVDEHLGGLDLNVTLPAPINGDGLIYDLANTEWKTQRFTKSVNGSFPDPLGDITVSLTKVETGTLAARPPAGTPSLTNAEVYIVSGDPTASNNGRTFIYKTSTSLWYEINSLGGIGVADIRVVSYLGSNTVGTGTFNAPYQTIQYAINQTNFGTPTVIVVLPGTYTENISTSTHLNLSIVGLTSSLTTYPIELIGSITISGTATRVRVKDIQVQGNAGAPVPLVINGSVGRHVFDNVQFIPFTTSNCVTFTGTPQNFFTFTDCGFSNTGIVDLGTTNNTAACYFIRPRNLLSLRIPSIWSGGVSVTDSDFLGIVHSASGLGLFNCRQISSFVSTATSANGALYVHDSSCYVAPTNTYTVVNKSGTAPYRFRNFEIARAGNTINGVEMDTANVNRYIKLNDLQNVDLVTTPPVNDNFLKYNSATQRWIPGTAAGGYTYSTTAPLFTGISPGHIWVNSTSMEQYLYVKDDSNADVWISLGYPLPASNGSYTYSSAPPAVAPLNPGHIWVNSITLGQYLLVADDNGVKNWISLGTVTGTQQTAITNRNKIQNGSGLINQRYAGSPSFVIGSGWTWVVDRWRFETNIPNKLTLNAYNGTSISSNPSGFISHFGGRTTTAHTFAAGDYMFLSHGIEGYNLVDLLWGTSNAKPITISFWMFTNRAGTYSVALRDNIASISYVKNITHSGIGWEYKFFTVPGNTDPTKWNSNTNDRMLQICFDFGHGSTFRTSTTDAWIAGNFLASNTSTQVLSSLGANYAITGVQLEVGSTATQYENKTWQQELEIGERYFQKSYHYWDSIGTNIGRNSVTFNPWDPFDRFVVRFNRRMRTIPTLAITPPNVSGFGSLGRYSNGSTAVIGAINDLGDNSFAFGGNGNAIQFNVNGFHWWAESEV